MWERKRACFKLKIGLVLARGTTNGNGTCRWKALSRRRFRRRRRGSPRRRPRPSPCASRPDRWPSPAGRDRPGRASQSRLRRRRNVPESVDENKTSEQKKMWPPTRRYLLDNDESDDYGPIRRYCQVIFGFWAAKDDLLQRKQVDVEGRSSL